MRILSALLISTAIAFASPAAAQVITVSDTGAATQENDKTPQLAPTEVLKEAPSTTVTVYSTLYSSYVLADIAASAYKKSVVQSGVTVNFKNGVYVDLWNSTPFGDLNNYGEEIDLTVGYAKKVGRVELSGSIAYFAVQPLGRFDDDVVQANVRAGIPIKVGPATVTPYVQPQVWLGVKTFPNQAFIRTGSSFNLPLQANWSLSGDASEVFDLTYGGRVFRSDAALTREFKNGFTLSAIMKISGHAPVVFGLGFSKKF